MHGQKKLQAYPILFLTICGFQKYQKFASNRKKYGNALLVQFSLDCMP